LTYTLDRIELKCPPSGQYALALVTLERLIVRVKYPLASVVLLVKLFAPTVTFKEAGLYPLSVVPLVLHTVEVVVALTVIESLIENELTPSLPPLVLDQLVSPVDVV
jgi:hypothetical protein